MTKLTLNIHPGAILGGALLSLALGGPALADEMQAKEIAIAAKTLGFMTPKAAPGAKIVILPGAAPLSLVQSSLPGATVQAGDIALASGASVVFVGSADEAKKVAGKGTVTISNKPDCVDQNACVIAIETSPKLSILVSRAAAQAAGIDFDPNFKMMITER